MPRNRGASSVYWAGMSSEPQASLPRTEIVANMHGKSGAACRLQCMLGAGRIVAGDGQFSDPWPHTHPQFPVDHSLLFQAAPCNQGSITRGDRVGELELMCRHAGFPVVRCDQETSLKAHLGEIQGEGTT